MCQLGISSTLFCNAVAMGVDLKGGDVDIVQFS